MEQHNSKTRADVPPETEKEPSNSQPSPAEVLPPQQGSLPDGGDFSSAEPVGGSKPDPISTGPNVKDTIAGRN